MLNKKICRRCYLERKISQKHNNHFEDDWEEGFFACLIYAGKYEFVNNPPPQECPYYMEQLVNQDAK